MKIIMIIGMSMFVSVLSTCFIYEARIQRIEEDVWMESLTDNYKSDLETIQKLIEYLDKNEVVKLKESLLRMQFWNLESLVHMIELNDRSTDNKNQLIRTFFDERMNDVIDKDMGILLESMRKRAIGFMGEVEDLSSSTIEEAK